MYSVTRFNQFLKYVVVLHLLVFLICIGLLFHSRGLIRVPDGVFLTSSFLISLFDTFYLKVQFVVTLALTLSPFFCHTVYLFAYV